MSALGIPNDFYAGDEEEDEGLEKPKGRFSRAQAENLEKRKELRATIRQFKRVMRREILDKKFEPFALKNRVYLQQY